MVARVDSVGLCWWALVSVGSAVGLLCCNCCQNWLARRHSWVVERLELPRLTGWCVEMAVAGQVALLALA